MRNAPARGKVDKNFDTLFENFKKRIYGTAKGAWRLKLLQEDLAHLHDSDTPLRVWDAGCGMGQMALWFAEAGHTLICNDISQKMLHEAQRNFAEAGCEAQWHHAAAQDIAEDIEPVDVLMYHAVIEWTAKPLETLEVLLSRLKPGGTLSLLFYNYHSFVYRTALKGGWRLPFLMEESNWYGKGKKLTPPHPQKPEVLEAFLREKGFDITRTTGIRVFHDYMTPEAKEASDEEELWALEYTYARQFPYTHMARYVHIICKNRKVSNG